MVEWVACKFALERLMPAAVATIFRATIARAIAVVVRTASLTLALVPVFEVFRCFAVAVLFHLMAMMITALHSVFRSLLSAVVLRHQRTQRCEGEEKCD